MRTLSPSSVEITFTAHGVLQIVDTIDFSSGVVKLKVDVKNLQTQKVSACTKWIN
jgi:hypothetical protein